MCGLHGVADARGRAIAFFSQYCTTCAQEAPALRAWAAKAGKHYRVSGVGFRETTSETKAFAKSLGFTFPVVGDPDGKRAKALKVGLPTIIVIRRHGHEVRRIDYSKWASASAAPRRYLLIRYLRLTTDVAGDRAFAAGAARDPVARIKAVPLMCDPDGTAKARLAAARITAPVTLDTSPDCASRLDATLDGVTSRAGPARLFAPGGRPVASVLNVIQHLEHIRVPGWMDVPTYKHFSPDSSGSLNVPLSPLITRSSTLQPAGDAIIQGFFYLCDACVHSKGAYQVQAWREAHPGTQVVGATCDGNVREASAYVYEHGWTFPVLSYKGPLSSGACFMKILFGRFDFFWFGDVAFAWGGRVSGDDAACAYPGYPADTGTGCKAP